MLLFAELYSQQKERKSMLKSKKFWLAVILIVVTNIGSAVGCMFLAEKMTAIHIFSVYSSLNFKKIEDTKLLLTAIANEILKNPEQAIVKIEKLQQQIPNSYEGFRTKEELKEAGFDVPGEHVQ